YSSQSAPYQILQALTDSPLVVRAQQASQKVYYYDVPAADASPSNRYLAMRTTTQTTGWQVFVQQPLSQIQREIERYYLLTSALVLVAIGLSMLFARSIAGNVTRPLEQLITTAREFASNGVPHQHPVLAGTAPAEVARVVLDF